MKTLFNITSNKTPGSEHTLLLEAGNHFCCYAYLHKPTKAIDSLQYVAYEEKASEEALTELVSKLGETNVQSVAVCAAFPQALLVPNKFFQEDGSLLDLIYGLPPGEAHFHDAIPEWQMTTVYTMPQQLRRAIQDSFTSVDYYHAYTAAIKIYNGYIADNQILVHFTAQSFRLLLKKDSNIQLAQTYTYKTPLDVIYYLLKICAEFTLNQQVVHVVLSGLVEKKSALFTELDQYFSNVHFAHPPEMSVPGDHPHHFFTPLYNLASCVS